MFLENTSQAQSVLEVSNTFLLKVILMAQKVKDYFKSLRIVAYLNIDYLKIIYHIQQLYQVLLKKVQQEKVMQIKI